MLKHERKKKVLEQKAEMITESIRNKTYVSINSVRREFGWSTNHIKKILGYVKGLATSLNTKTKYYTTKDVALAYPKLTINGIVFSFKNSLLYAVYCKIIYSTSGFTSEELEKEFNMDCKNVLTKLVQLGKIKHYVFEGRRVYMCTSKAEFRKQFRSRKVYENPSQPTFTYEELMECLDKELKEVAEKLIPQEFKEGRRIDGETLVRILFLQRKYDNSSDRETERKLEHDLRFKQLTKAKSAVCHSTISEVKNELDVKFFVAMFKFFLKKLLEEYPLETATIVIDSCHSCRFKRDHDGYKAHTAIIYELKAIIGFVVTKGKAHDAPLFKNVMKMVEEQGVKIKYVIADAGYDSKKIFAYVHGKLNCLAVIPTRDYEGKELQLSLDFCFEEIYVMETENLARNYDVCFAKRIGEKIRNLAHVCKEKEWWKEIYNMRTSVERLFSCLKFLLRLDQSYPGKQKMPDGKYRFRLKNMVIHAYQVAIYSLGHALFAIRKGCAERTACYKTLIC